MGALNDSSPLTSFNKVTGGFCKSASQHQPSQAQKASVAVSLSQQPCSSPGPSRPSQVCWFLIFKSSLLWTSLTACLPGTINTVCSLGLCTCLPGTSPPGAQGFLPSLSLGLCPGTPSQNTSHTPAFFLLTPLTTVSWAT